MAKKYRELSRDLDKRLDALPNNEGAEIRARNRARLDQEIASHAQALKNVRRARRLTQTQLARNLGVTQAEVSRIENRADMQLSTLASYLEAMGGELQLVATFDGEPVELAIGDLVGDEPFLPSLLGATEAVDTA